MHVSVGPILGTTKWRAKRDATVHDRATEGDARAVAKVLATGGLQIVETSFTAPAPLLDEELWSTSFEDDAELLEIAAQPAAPGPPPAPSLAGRSIPKLKAALNTGEYDSRLKAVDDAERDGRNRLGARKAIQARVDTIKG